jgi:hypothetical protein
VTKLGNGQVAILAPAEMPAKYLVPVIAALAKHDVILAAKGAGGPVGWALPAAIPVMLDGRPDPKAVVLAIGSDVPKLVAAYKDATITGMPTIRIDPKTTNVGHLAGTLSFAGFKGATRAAIVAAP